MLEKNEVLQQRYRIVRQLGHGGMGAVYEAKDERLGSAVALKEIIIELDKIPTAAQRELFRRAFEREARLLANLHHEVFPRVMDYFSEENRQFLIMELVFGDDLGESLHKNKTPFALNEALQWADHLLDALDYLHIQTPSIFHRDIKPQNLKVTSRGKIKLLDFGIAKSVDQTASTTTNQTFVGATPDYAPIEQLLRAITPTFREFIVLKHSAKANAVLNQKTDARCDLYAVGATFYHLLTNRAPVDSAKRSLEIWEGNADPLPKPDELNADIPPIISAWLMKALEIERKNRFSSALEMQQALQDSITVIKEKKPQEEKTLRLLEQEVLLLSNLENPNQSLHQMTTEKFIRSGNANGKMEERSRLLTNDEIFPEASDFEPVSAADFAKTNAEIKIPPFFNESLISIPQSTVKSLPPVETTQKKDSYLFFKLLSILGAFIIFSVIGVIVWQNSRTEQPNNTVIEPTVSVPVEPSISTTNLESNQNDSNAQVFVTKGLTNTKANNQTNTDTNKTTTPSPMQTPTASPSTKPTAAPKPTSGQSFDLSTIDRLFAELNNDPTATGYIINYGTPGEIAERNRAIRNYISRRGFNASRITIVIGGGGSGTYTKVYVVPRGAENPNP